MNLDFTYKEKKDFLYNNSYESDFVSIKLYIIGRSDLESIEPIKMEIFYRAGHPAFKPDLSEEYLLNSDKYMDYSLDRVFDKVFKSKLLKILM